MRQGARASARRGGNVKSRRDVRLFLHAPMPGVDATTKSPAARPLTAEPTASIWPTPSLPAAAGKAGLAAAPKPAMSARSVGVIGAASMRTRTAVGARALH